MSEKKKKVRTPKQKRSQSMVEDIIYASTLLFEKIHFEKINTNNISKLTGVSIGSIYQYFKNKEGIFSNVIDQRLEENRNKIRVLVKAPPQQDFDSYVNWLVDEMISHFLSQKGYLKALIYFQFKLQKNQLIIQSRWKMAEILASEFKERFPYLESFEELQKKFFYLICSAFGIIYLYSQTESLPISLEDIKSEMKRNVKMYLLEAMTNTICQSES